MAILQAQCDDCKIIGTPKEVYEDYNGACRCERCHIKRELELAKENLKEKITWCHDSHINPAKAEVEKLEAKLSSLGEK